MAHKWKENFSDPMHIRFETEMEGSFLERKCFLLFEHLSAYTLYTTHTLFLARLAPLVSH